ncbi:MAG: phosphoenolpyruvate synthase [Chloroflexi bacterium HGW-Chloroflexi-1]|nr:MAG: phosphoenolpyruvate synthase [Chloroflexi bacterium HGW-Chloroflexi-1]
MTTESSYIPKVMRIHLQLSQYPVLGDVIRERMRDEIFRRGIVTREQFATEAREKAIDSQRREGITRPYEEEPSDVWERRLAHFCENLTDFYFAYNLPYTRFEEIVQEVLRQRIAAETVLAYNPELASWSMLFQQGEQYEALPPEERAKVWHHLQETKVVLIKAMISDQLAFVRVAKEYLTIADLQWIRAHRIGRGKIGGKAAGMMLAWKILQQTFARPGDDGEPINLVLPQSYFIGADVLYDFLAVNNLLNYINQKYKNIEQVESEYPEIKAAYTRGRFPGDILDRLRDLLAEVGPQPLIVRSSSLLEDRFDASFVGKYESVFCPNQGPPGENLQALTQAIALVYASISKPDAILYRKQMGLLDFDERMAVLIQAVQEARYGDYFFPAAAGVAYSRNPFIWNPKLRREDGFMRIVAGLGTRAVERVGEDYPRMVALSHPQLRPETSAQQIRYYSQYYMDAIDMTANKFGTRRISDVLAGDYPGLRLLASLDQDDYISPMVVNAPNVDPRSLVMTFDGLLGRTPFVEQLKTILKALEFSYGRPVDIEFTVSVGDAYPVPTVTLHLLQCRTQSSQVFDEEIRIPEQLPERDIIFGTVKLVPTGRVRNIAYIVYVDPEAYAQVADPSLKLELARLVGRLNQRLEAQPFILMGPGRWGSANPDLGLKVGYADIYNTRALVEIGWTRGPNRPTLSYGTHFFQDLVESHIYPLAIYPGEPGNPFRQEFFTDARNALPALLPDDARFEAYARVIDVPATTGGRVLELVMSGEEGKALAFLTYPDG